LILAATWSESGYAEPVTPFCKPINGYEEIINNFNSITQGFNDRDWALIGPYADPDISLTRIEGKTKKTHKKSKAAYKEHLEKDAWKNDPKWSDVACDVTDIGSDMVKIIATYDFTFTKPSDKTKATVPSFAVLLFKKKSGVMTDFTVGSLAK
jgi:hypothetical protein